MFFVLCEFRPNPETPTHPWPGIYGLYRSIYGPSMVHLWSIYGTFMVHLVHLWQRCTILIISLTWFPGVPSYSSSWNQGGHHAPMPKVKRAKTEFGQVNGATETSPTELIRKSSQAELGVGFFYGLNVSLGTLS